MRGRGFTLIELIVVIVLLGIVGLASTSLIRFGALIFTDIANRDEILSSSRFVIERLNRELREALPNSVRETNTGAIQCLEYIPVVASSYYSAIPETGRNGSQVKAIPPDGYSFTSGESLVVYPSVKNAQLDVYQDNANKRHLIDSFSPGAAGELATFTLTSNTTYAQSSPARRLYIVNQPVSYCVIGGKLYRYSQYGYNATQQTIGMGAGVLMADILTNDLSVALEQPFSVTQATLTRNAYVTLYLKFGINDGELVFNNEVHVANAP